MDKVAIFIAGDERGCDLANAAIELTEAGHPGLRVIEEFKMRQRERLTNLCKAAGASQPDLLADTLFLLIEGARVSRRSVGTNGPSANLVRTSRGVIASFGVRPPDARQSILETESEHALTVLAQRWTRARTPRISLKAAHLTPDPVNFSACAARGA